jgi:glutathione-specific gamma-glutamylcyclotransferase
MPRHTPRPLRLTAAHVARIHRTMPDLGTISGIARASDADFAAWVGQVHRADPAPQAPLRLFAYGSLLWKPEVAHVAEAPALLRGWHRSFCMELVRFRGSPELPGRMMALDRGGACRGVLLTLEPGEKAEQMDKLIRREMPFAPASNAVRWVRAETAGGPVPALVFVMNRTSALYAGRTPLDRVADLLARACGHAGTGAEYLLRTTEALEARGIRDSMLWQLQSMVADRIEAQQPG